MELQFARLRRRQSRRGQLVHFNEPLFAQVRLNGVVAAVAGGDGIVVFFFFDQQAGRFQILHGFFAAKVAVHPQVFFGAVNHFAFVVDDGHHFQVVALAHFIVGGVVGGGNF